MVFVGQQITLRLMLTHSRHRYLTRWPRRLVFALATALLLAAAWYSWRAWQTAGHPLEPAGQLASTYFAHHS